MVGLSDLPGDVISIVIGFTVGCLASLWRGKRFALTVTSSIVGAFLASRVGAFLADDPSVPSATLQVSILLASSIGAVLAVSVYTTIERRWQATAQAKTTFADELAETAKVAEAFNDAAVAETATVAEAFNDAAVAEAAKVAETARAAKRRIFISYRREDSAAAAGRIYDRLEGESAFDILMDVDSVPLGFDFVKVINEEVAKCDVLIAVIGRDWLDTRDEAGGRRLDDLNDFVRLEIAAALQRRIPVIPILVDGTKMPKAAQLPENLQQLSRRNALDLRNASFRADMGRLVKQLKAEPLRPPTS